MDCILVPFSFGLKNRMATLILPRQGHFSSTPCHQILELNVKVLLAESLGFSVPYITYICPEESCQQCHFFHFFPRGKKKRFLELKKPTHTRELSNKSSISLSDSSFANFCQKDKSYQRHMIRVGCHMS